MKTYDLKLNTGSYKKEAKVWGDRVAFSPSGEKMAVTNRGLTVDEHPFFVIAGEFHFSRSPRDCWEDSIIRMKATGINTISTYVFWINHEEIEGVFDWTGSNDLRKFIELCQKHHMYLILRVGPYAHGEVRNGGFPDWLYGRHFQVRSNDGDYLEYVRKLYEQIAIQVKGLFFEEGDQLLVYNWKMSIYTPHQHGYSPTVRDLSILE